MYDYVIVGAGSAGCVLASRLTEQRDVRVLLLEAGPPDSIDEIAMPAAMNTLFKTAYDWNYATTEQPDAAHRRVYWPRGRTLGGSSATNAMIYIRGNQYDYDSWRDLHGCTGWGYADLLPYFRRAEDNTRGSSTVHGSGGPLRVEELRYRSALTKAFVDAAKSYGLPGNGDFNGAQQLGVGFYQVTHRKGRRWSTANAYLRPAARRDNLTVVTDALATEIVTADGRARGVRYRHRGVEQEALAEREVLLCGGAINSPQLLMLSGIGPADHLREHGIDVVAEAPGVGGNLIDHPIVTLIWHTPNTRALWEQVTPWEIVRWKLTRTGPLTSNLAEAGGFARTDPTLPAPDIQWCVVPSPYLNQGLDDPNVRGLSALVTLLTPASRGTVRLESADPQWKPAIDPAYLSERTDVDRLVAGVHLTREIAAEQPLARLITKELAPGGEITGDDALTEWVRTDLATLYHPVGTCAMGADASAVCDPELRVRGIDGLRVVDASVMPDVPRGNTNAPTIAIAERAADLIAGREPLAPVEALGASQPPGEQLVRE